MGRRDQTNENSILATNELILLGEFVVRTSRIAAQSGAIALVCRQTFNIVDAVGGRARTFMRRKVPMRSAPQRGMASPQLRA
jgi:hypothetical protein